jgi:hypothetical protein
MNYSDVFSRKRMLNTDLKNQSIYSKLIDQGYNYICRSNCFKFDQVLRFPTVGCYVELFKYPNPGTVLINSSQGKKLINKLCYY